MRDLHGISLREVALSKRWLKVLAAQAQVAAADPSDDEALFVLNDMVIVYVQMVCRRAHPVPLSVRRNIIISNIPEFCGTDYRFRSRSDVLRLFRALRWPARCGPFDNGAYLDGEITFLYFLRRISSTSRISDHVSYFGRDAGTWTRAFKWAVVFVEAQFSATVSTFHPEFAARFLRYSEVIRVEVNKHLENNNSNQHFAQLDVCGFIDNKCVATPAPGTGPAHDGPGAPRRDPTGQIQQSVYSGWKKAHGFKIETVTAPDGLTMHWFGAVSMRHNDLFSLNLSDSNQHLADAQRPGGVPTARQLRMYGDSIYPNLSHLRRRHNAHPQHPNKAELDREDKALSSVRQTVEWEYQEGDQLFPLSVYKDKLKLTNAPYREIFFARLWLRNCYLCLYGGKFSARFALQPPTLDELCSW
jgi:hypothetical protein